MVAILVGITLQFSNIYSTQPILPLLSKTFHVTPAISSLTVSVVVIGLGISALIYGPLSDRIGRKPVIVFTSFALLAPTLGAAFAPNFAIFLASRALQGLLIPGTTAVGLAYVQEDFPPRWRNLGTSAYASSTALGGLIGRLQGGFIATAFGWQWAFGSFLITILFSAILMLLWLPKPAFTNVKNIQIKPRELIQVYTALPAFFRQRRIIGGAVIGLTMFLSFISIFTYLPYRVQQPPFSLSADATSLLYLVYLGGFFVTPLAGLLAAQLGQRAIIGLSLGLMMIGMLLTSLFNLVIIIAGLLLLNIGLLAAHAAASSFVGDQAKSGRGSATSFYLVWYYVGGMIGPPLSGLAWQSSGWIGVLVITLGSTVLAIISLCTLCI